MEGFEAFRLWRGLRRSDFGDFIVNVVCDCVWLFV